MDEYIEREAALQAQNKSMNLAECRKRLERIPAADVRPVVLCRDCKHNQGTKTWIDNDLTADCMNGHGYPPLDWFCADGVKREES